MNSYLLKKPSKMVISYASLISQNKYKNHTSFSANFFKINEGDQKSGEIELFINLNNKNNLPESDIINVDIES